MRRSKRWTLTTAALAVVTATALVVGSFGPSAEAEDAKYTM
jgi:hypothetical protein